MTMMLERVSSAALISVPSSDENVEGSSHTRILVNTSYGGRLVMSLDNGTLLFIHLKDKKLIRHKKRWSQVSLALPSSSCITL